MFDLQALAYQADLTRVITFMTAREASLMTFPHLGVSMQHHEASHHNYEQEKLDALHKININQSELFAYYLDKMDAVKEANGSMLDNSILYFGTTLSDPSVHSQRDLPVMLAAVRGGQLATAAADHRIRRRYADQQYAPDPPGQAGRSDRQTGQQHGTAEAGPDFGLSR